jgi:hypothetical protein
MADFLKKTLLSLFMDKKARETLEKRLEAKTAPAAPPLPPASKAPPMTDARKELIKAALVTRRKATKSLDSLSKVDRMKLQAMALEAFNLERKDGQKKH